MEHFRPGRPEHPEIPRPVEMAVEPFPAEVQVRHAASRFVLEAGDVSGEESRALFERLQRLQGETQS